MAKRNVIRRRRLRRQARSSQRFGIKAKPTHKSKTGRTGQVNEKRLRCPSTKNSGYRSIIINIKYVFYNGTLHPPKIDEVLGK